MHDMGVAHYGFLIMVTTADQDLVNNFGYRREEQFQELIIRRLMKAVAEHPHIVSIEVNPVSLDPEESEFFRAQNERVEEDDEDEY